MNTINSIDFGKAGGLVPCIVQDAATDKVLMLGFMDEAAYRETQTSKKVTFYSRSRKRLWTKGETSGNYLELISLLPDCDGDTLLARVRPTGPVCHTGADTCFNESNKTWNLRHLQEVIDHRRANPKEGSYTNELFQAGINRIAQKVGEEAVELVIEAREDAGPALLNEAADLVYHLIVLLTATGHSIDDVVKVLEERHKQAPSAE